MAEDASLEWLPKKNKLSQSCSVFTTLRYTVLDTWSIGIFLRITPTPCIFASYSGASSCEMDCHWGVALRKVLYQEWCVSTRKTWTLHLSLTSFFYELFSGLGKVIGSPLYSGLCISWCEVILRRSGYAHFCISYILKLIAFVLQVELRNSSLWDFHNW